MAPRSRLSHHAVTRYVQRVLGVTVTVDPAFEGSEMEALAHCEAAGTTPAALEKTVVTPAVVAAIEMGATKIKQSYGTMVIGRYGVIVTIRFRSRVKSRSKILTRREGHRAAQALNRRRRGVPAL